MPTRQQNENNAELKKASYELSHEALSKVLVGLAGFELATPCTPCKCATRLRYKPKKYVKTQEKDGAAGRN
jgi:hypothetical protein